jgi:phosphopantetheinyl transferase
MTRDDSAWVQDWFAANARDWTPAPARDAAYVVFAPVSHDAEVSRRCASVLSAGELAKAARFLREERRARFKQQRAFRRYCGARVLGSSAPLSLIDFAESEKGRPHLPQLPGISFSFSSCRFGFLGAWSSTHDIGVDIEDRTRRTGTSEFARRYFCEAEAKAVEASGSARTFFQIWTLKEAALKSIGEGLPFGLEAFQFELTPTLRVVQAPGGPQRFCPHVIEGADSCAAALVTTQRATAAHPARG